jgi:hypothetical protein
MSGHSLSVGLDRVRTTAMDFWPSALWSALLARTIRPHRSQCCMVSSRHRRDAADLRRSNGRPAELGDLRHGAVCGCRGSYPRRWWSCMRCRRPVDLSARWWHRSRNVANRPGVTDPAGKLRRRVSRRSDEAEPAGRLWQSVAISAPGRLLALATGVKRPRRST